MVTLFNSTLDIGSLINASTVNVTGSNTLTLLLIVVVLLMIALLFKEPIVLFGLIMIPLFMVFASFEGVGGLFYTILTIFGIIIAWQFAKIIFSWGK